MSRIDQAWRRASGARLDGAEHAQPDEDRHTGETGLAALHTYPVKNGDPGAPVERLVPHRAASAPRAAERPAVGHTHPALDRKLVTGQQAHPLAVEQYRRLAATLHALQTERGLKTLMVTSAVPGEGKTLTIVNLALTLTQAFQRRVLLVDADVRRPFVHQIFRLPNSRGLADCLRTENADVPLLQVSDRLSVLPSGRSDQPMVLASDRLRALVDHAAATFDWVLLDAAPVAFMADAELLARTVGAVLFVIAAQTTPHALVRRAIAALDPDCIVGTVLNSVSEADIPAAAYYPEYGYGAGGD